jgi:PAS domain-containing protein
MTIDTTRRIVRLNAAAEVVFDIHERLVIGAVAHNLLHHTHADGSPHPIEQCPIVHILATGEPVSVDYDVFFTPNGQRIPMSYKAAPVFVNREIAGVSIAFRRLDVGANVLLDSYLASNVLPIARGLSNGIVLAANDRFLDLIGCSREELNAGRLNWAELTTQETLAQDARAFAELERGAVACPYDKAYRDRAPVRLVMCRYGSSQIEGFGVAIPLKHKARAYALADTLYDALARRLLPTVLPFLTEVPLELLSVASC